MDQMATLFGIFGENADFYKEAVLQFLSPQQESLPPAGAGCFWHLGQGPFSLIEVGSHCDFDLCSQIISTGPFPIPRGLGHLSVFFEECLCSSSRIFEGGVCFVVALVFASAF